MKKFRKPLKFYITLFIISSLLIAAYSIYRLVKEDIGISELYSIWFLPLFFILIYYGSDFILDKIFNRKKKVDYEGKFLEAIGQRMRQSNLFSIEDFRRLQINMKFQDSLTIAHKIYQDGENDLYNIKKLERKFMKDSIEYRAMEYVIAYIQENMEIDRKKDTNTL